MIFLTAMVLGMTAVMLRSAFCIVLICLMMAVAFGAAAFVSAGPVAFLPFVIAVAGYNTGIVSLLAGMLVVHRLRTA